MCMEMFWTLLFPIEIFISLICIVYYDRCSHFPTGFRNNDALITEKLWSRRTILDEFWTDRLVVSEINTRQSIHKGHLYFIFIDFMSRCKLKLSNYQMVILKNESVSYFIGFSFDKRNAGACCYQWYSQRFKITVIFRSHRLWKWIRLN